MNLVVTGAASGIGRQLVTLLAQHGHRVLATDVDEPRLIASAAEQKWPADSVVTFGHDVTSAQAWSAAIALALERFGKLDALINVAGVLRVEPVEDLRPESVVLQLDVNARGVIFGTSAAAKVMVGQGHGHIINIASMAALAPVPGISVYSASKFAVRGFSLAAAQELESRGVRVTVVCPDAVDTPMVDYQLDRADAALTFSGPRVLPADEVARAVIGLLHGKPRFELVIPWSRGVLARISTLLPRFIHRRISARLTQKGLARQQSIRQQRKS
jgi:NAD(P)-dependent dehydrogenase (short-subunit alcohol dehydrogenase family)